MKGIEKIGGISGIKKELFRSEGYVLWKIRSSWDEIAGSVIAGQSFPENLERGRLLIRVYDAAIHHSIVTYGDVIMEKIKNICGKDMVREVHSRRDNGRKRTDFVNRKDISGENVIQEGEKVEKRPSGNNLNQKEGYEDIVLSDEEMEDIRRSIRKIDPRYKEIAERLEKIAINTRKRDKYLLSNGFKVCPECGEIFFPGGRRGICFKCYDRKEGKKKEDMKRVLMDSPLIGEKEAVRISGADTQTYYEVRDIMAQHAYEEMLAFYLERKKQIEISEEYSFEIKEEANVDFEVYLKNYIDYKVGTDSYEVFLAERKKVIRRLRNDTRFIKE